MAEFSKEDIELAKKVEKNYGVPASVTLGAYALESGYGKSTVGKNNYFNIKGDGTNGYRDYESKEESFNDYGKLLSTNRYTSKTKDATNAKEYVQAVKDAGYAEDPNYVSKVVNIIETNNLEQYDNGNYGKISNNSSSTDLDWWGDIVIVVFAIILLIGGVVFVGLAVTNNSLTSGINDVKKLVKKAVS